VTADVRSGRADPVRGALGDTTDRDYGAKLDRFWAMCEPEAQDAITWLGVRDGHTVVDAGCGAGGPTRLLRLAAGRDGCVVGLDLSWAHAVSARAATPGVAQADVARPPLRPACADVVWASNTLHHLNDPVGGLVALGALLRAAGTLAVVQSSMLPDMVFAWDARLEREVTMACRRHYAARYGLDPDELSAPRAWVGWLRDAGFRDVRARTFTIDRVAPLDPPARDWLLEVLFRGHWLGKVEQHLAPADVEALHALVDPESSGFCLDRPDFHHVQTLTVVAGRRP
jgi:SAM-dependent methyltransferase